MAIADPDPDFDTLAYAQTLKAAGVPRFREGRLKQAEAHAEAARTVRAGLATKADLRELKAELKAEIEHGVNRTLTAMLIVTGVIIAALVAATVAIMNQLP